MQKAKAGSWAPVVAGMILCAALVAGCNGDGSSSDPPADPPSSGSTASGSSSSSSASMSSSASSSSSSTASNTSTTSGNSSSSITPSQNAAVTLSWQPPTENTDGTALTDLSGYVINYGTQAGNYTSAITLTNPGLTTYVVDNLSPGTYYFSITATASDGTQSTPSPEVSATVD